MTWLDLGAGVYACRHTELDQTIGLVVGAERCLVIDTGTDETHGAELATAVREVTPLPWTVVLTHAHFDHVFGTAAFGACPVWAHERCHAALLKVEPHRQDWVARYRTEGKPDLADRLASARLVLPTDLLTDRVTLDLGDREVALVHPGPGHTDHDVVVHVPDAGVVFAGDLVEQGAPPSAGPDAVLAAWPAALDSVLALGADITVPGHGEPVDRTFVLAQRDELALR